MTFCDIINVIAEVSHLFQWAANNLYRKMSFENEFITEANAYAKFQITSILISIAFYSRLMLNYLVYCASNCR